MHNPLLVGALKNCKTEDDVETVFKKFRTKGYETKMKYLSISRGNPMTFFSGSTGKGDEEELYSKYLTVRSMFLTGSWR